MATTGAKDSSGSEGHGRKLTQTQESLYVARGNDSYFESNYLESELQDFYDPDKRLVQIQGRGFP